MGIKFDRKKNKGGWNRKKNNNLVLKIISNKINSNQKSTNRVWHIKKLKVGEVEKNQIL
jgi:hypothetical protein